jgi:hypothetical protein
VHILSRNLSDMKSGNYSMLNAQTYTTASPGATEPLTVEIVEGREIQIDIVTQ